MSGPKRADLEAELRSANESARAASGLVAEAEHAVLQTLVGELNQPASSAALSGADGQLGGCRTDVSSVTDARDAVDLAQSLRAQADQATDDARRRVSAAKDAQQRCVDEYAGATAEYDRARSQLDGRGPRRFVYDAEMRWAKEATRRYRSAADLARTATRVRAEARTAVTDALSLAQQAHAAESDAGARVRAAVRESAERDRAEQEARHIAEEARRRATIAVKGAAASIDSIPADDVDKFFPGRRAALSSDLVEAEAKLATGNSREAQRSADRIAAATAELAHRVAATREEFNRNRSAAKTAHRQLRATIDASDTALILTWSDDPDVLDSAPGCVADISALISAEEFTEARMRASELSERLQIATATAAEALAANHRRTSIGDAIIDVLEEMSFDVTFEPGTKSEPMKISGQVPAVSGEGDFLLELPLDGEVDFEVTDTNADGSACSNAVATLRQRLADRGIAFTVTDWGHGHDPAAASPSPPSGRRARTEEKTITRRH